MYLIWVHVCIACGKICKKQRDAQVVDWMDGFTRVTNTVV